MNGKRLAMGDAVSGRCCINCRMDNLFFDTKGNKNNFNFNRGYTLAMLGCGLENGKRRFL